MTQHIVIIGSGFAGMYSALAAARLRDLQGVGREALEITVVAPDPALTVRPRLYEAHPIEMSAPLEALFHSTEVRYIQGKAETIDAASDRIVVLAPDGTRSALPYDRLILAAGSLQGFLSSAGTRSGGDARLAILLW